MESLRLVAAILMGFALGAMLFHAPTVRAQAGAKIQSIQPGMTYQRITGTPVGISCLPAGQAGVLCYVLTQ